MVYGWLTPDSGTFSLVPYQVYLPDDDTMRAVFYGAFLLLCKEQNWEQFGTMTPAEAAEYFEQCWRQTYTTGSGLTEVT
jgi:hypothetical protein